MDVAGMDRDACGLRERKKRQTREDLHRAALDLVEEKGFAAVTTDEIAQRAGVSARTFFNYFPSKDAAVLGTQPDDIAELERLIREGAEDEDALESLRRVSVAMVAPAAADPVLRAQRRRVLLTEPSLAPALVRRNITLENALTTALEDRLGTPHASDVRIRIAVAAALGAVRACFEHLQAGGPGELEDQIDEAFDLLRDGLGPHLARP